MAGGVMHGKYVWAIWYFIMMMFFILAAIDNYREIIWSRRFFILKLHFRLKFPYGSI